MKVANIETLQNCSTKHRDSAESLATWLVFVRAATWKSSVDIKRHFASASFLPGDRVVFNIKGNTYRLIVVVNYPFTNVEIRFAGTHAEYDKVKAEKI